MNILINLAKLISSVSTAWEFFSLVVNFMLEEHGVVSSLVAACPCLKAHTVTR